jgi:flavin-binding protein dodecin
MQQDNVVGDGAATFTEIDIRPHSPTAMGMDRTLCCGYNPSDTGDAGAFLRRCSPTSNAVEANMDHVYPVTEVYGSSTESLDDAIRTAISTAHASIRNLEWFKVTEIRGHIDNDGSVGHFQVGVKLGFRLDRSAASPA